MLWRTLTHRSDLTGEGLRSLPNLWETIMTIRILAITLLVISVIGIMLVNETHLIPYVGWMWLIISHGLFVLGLYAIKLILDKD